jgi:hypothetical protein
MGNPEVVKEGQVGKRNIGSFMESFVNKAKEIVLGKNNKPSEGLFKTASLTVKTVESESWIDSTGKQHFKVKESTETFPEKMTLAEAKGKGFFKNATSYGFGMYTIAEPLDGGLGSIWYLERGEDGKDYLMKQTSPEGDIIRRFQQKQALLKKQAETTKTKEQFTEEDTERVKEKAKQEAKEVAEKYKKEKKVAVTPPGWEKTVKKMKEKPEIENPWALAWSMKGKGYKPGGEDKRK